eukprot:15612204-Heterocapsa_arctica.AAC.1
MPPEPLLALLGCMEAQSNAWFDSKLQEHNCKEDEEANEVDHVALHVADAPAVMAGEEPPSDM